MHLRTENDNRVRWRAHGFSLAVTDDCIQCRDTRRTCRSDTEHADAESAYENWNAVAIHSC